MDDRVDEIRDLEVLKLRSKLRDVRVSVSCGDLQRERLTEVEEQVGKVVIGIAERYVREVDHTRRTTLERQDMVTAEIGVQNNRSKGEIRGEIDVPRHPLSQTHRLTSRQLADHELLRVLQRLDCAGFFVAMLQVGTDGRRQPTAMERTHECGDLLGRSAAVLVREARKRQPRSRKVAIRRVTMRPRIGVWGPHHVSGHSQWQLIRGFRQESELAVDFLPYFASLGKSEHELGIDQVGPRGPSFPEEVQRADLDPWMIRLHAMPIDRPKDHGSMSPNTCAAVSATRFRT